MAPDDLRSLLATFGSVFEHVRIFATIEDSDLVILGSNEPLELEIEKANQLFSDPKLRADFDGIDVHNPYELLVYYRMDEEGVRKIGADAGYTTDDNMRIEYSAPKQLYKSTGTANIRTLMESPQVPRFAAVHQSLAMAEAYGAMEDWVRGMIVLRDILQSHPGHVEAGLLWKYYSAQFQAGQEEIGD